MSCSTMLHEVMCEQHDYTYCPICGQLLRDALQRPIPVCLPVGAETADHGILHVRGEGNPVPVLEERPAPAAGSLPSV